MLLFALLSKIIYLIHTFRNKACYQTSYATGNQTAAEGRFSPKFVHEKDTANIGWDFHSPVGNQLK